MTLLSPTAFHPAFEAEVATETPQYAFLGMVRRGHDLHFIQVQVEPSGRVHGFVIQPEPFEPSTDLLDLMDREPASDFE